MIVASVLFCTGCATSRTSQNFCAHYEKDKQEYLATYDSEATAVNEAGQIDSLAGVFSAAGMSVQMMGSVAEMFADLENVAPDDIKPQVAQVHDAIKKQLDTMGSINPLDPGAALGTLFGTLATGLETSQSWEQVGKYIQQQCHTT